MKLSHSRTRRKEGFHVQTKRYISTTGALLRWVGLFAVALATMAGILGMHVISGTSVAHASPPDTVMTNSFATHPMAISDHEAPTSQTMSGTVMASVEPAGHHQPGSCSVTGDDGSMSMHGGCIPTFGSSGISVSPPRTLLLLSAVNVFADTHGVAFADRVADGPSLTQLSISRT